MKTRTRCKSKMIQRTHGVCLTKGNVRLITNIHWKWNNRRLKQVSKRVIPLGWPGKMKTRHFELCKLPCILIDSTQKQVQHQKSNTYNPIALNTLHSGGAHTPGGSRILSTLRQLHRTQHKIAHSNLYRTSREVIRLNPTT